MPYTVTFGRFDEHGKAMAGIIDQPFELSDALNHACRLLSEGEQDVAIQDGSGRSIQGDELIACCQGEKTLTPDLRAIPKPDIL
jgi:hypothetical protein